MGSPVKGRPRNTRDGRLFSHRPVGPREYCIWSSVGADRGERANVADERGRLRSGGQPAVSPRSPQAGRFAWSGRRFRTSACTGTSARPCGPTSRRCCRNAGRPRFMSERCYRLARSSRPSTRCWPPDASRRQDPLPVDSQNRTQQKEATLKGIHLQRADLMKLGWACEDLNLGPLPYQGSALTA